MITAAEARIKVGTSEATITRLLENIGKAIEKQADLGMNKLLLSQVSPYEKAFEVVSTSNYYMPEFTPLQKVLLTRLDKAGYSVTIESHTYDLNKTFGSMADASDPPDMQKSYYIQIRW